MPSATSQGQPPRQRLPAILAERALGVLGIAFFVILFAAISLGIIARYLGLPNFEWSFEIAEMAFLWVSFLGAVLAEVRGENAAFEILEAHLPPRAKSIVVRLRTLLVLVVGIFLFASAGAMVAQSGLNPTTVLRWPMATQLGAVLVGAAGIVIVGVARLLRRRSSGK